MVKERQKFLKSTLRWASYKWPPRNKAIKAARVSRGLYQCAVCEAHFKRHQVQLDHIIAVGSIDDLNGYAERLLCNAEGFQVLCKPCHLSKSLDELR